MTIAVTGSMAFDYIMSFSGSFTDYILPDKLQHLSVSFLVDSMRRERGGTAGNIAYSLALLKQPALLMASVGGDAKDYIADLNTLGIDTSAVLHLKDESTASFFVSTDQQNRQIANFYIGAMSKAHQVSFHKLEQSISIAIISPNAPDAMVQYVNECRDLDIKYLYDPSQQIPLISKENLINGIDGAYVLVVNDYEINLIMEKTGLSLDDILTRSNIVFITRGEDGSSIYINGEHLQIPILKDVDVADPTGAGDAYRCGILAAFRHNLSWLEAGRLGTLTASYALEHHGTQKHNYTVEQFAKRYFDNFERTSTMEQFFSDL